MRRLYCRRVDLIVFSGLVALLVVGWLSWREVISRRQNLVMAEPTIIKQVACARNPHV